MSRFQIRTIAWYEKDPNFPFVTGMKCGGTLSQRADRLFQAKFAATPDDIPRKLRLKKQDETVREPHS
jgi:hypothetical protein